MIPSEIKIDHYRALRNVAIRLGDYSALVGPNGVGKSTVLDALDFFLTPDRRVDDDDFQRGCDEPVSVTVTLTALSDDEKVRYADSLDEHGNLVVTKVYDQDFGSQYQVLGMRHKGFDGIRQAERTKPKSEFNTEFKLFAATAGYEIRAQRSAGDNLAELRRWEAEHPDQCENALVPFSFAGSTKDQLIPTTRFVYVPAVQDASETMDGARSPLTQMLKALVYPRLEADETFIALKRHVADRYALMFPAEGTPELVALAKRITNALEPFCPGASITLGWEEYEESLQIPHVLPRVVEDGIETRIGHKGHGLQRALIIAMLQAEDEYRSTMDGDSGNVHVVLMIEEPELYQHPTQSRHFRRVLARLASADGTSKVRVLVTTHSPDFISLDGIDAIRIIRREPGKTGAVPARRVSMLSLDEIAERYAKVTERAVDEQHLFRQLHVVDNIMREAFFANSVVLVEGVGDHGLLSAECAVEKIDLEGKGIVILACGGKSNMPLPICILDLLGIRYYAVFDSDRDPQQNRALLKALGIADKKISQTGTLATGVFERYAVLNPKIETVVRDAVGAKAFEEVSALVAEEFGRTSEQVLKNPITAERVLTLLRDRKLACPTLHDIAAKIAGL
jgi:energy-coupling factor transporter ATP-binding protein EcfA2